MNAHQSTCTTHTHTHVESLSDFGIPNQKFILSVLYILYIYIRVEWSKNFYRISKTAGSKTIDIGPRRKRVKFENNRTTFDPRNGPLKIAIFGPKTLILCKPILRGFKHQWRPPCCDKKPLILLVFMKKCFLPIENRSTGSPGPLK
jgi:hypothetical protein